MTSLIGQALLWIGFLGAALITVMQAEGDNLWSTPPIEPAVGQQVIVSWRDPETEKDVQISGLLETFGDRSLTILVDEFDPDTKAKLQESREYSRSELLWARTKISSQPWSKIHWPMYAMFAGLGWLGVVILRYTKAAGRKRVDGQQAGLRELVGRLGDASRGVSELADGIQHLTCEEVLDIIDQRLAPQLTAFADDRNVLKDHLGTAAFAQVMTEFASGERYLNRAWSAAADGYVDEVTTAVGHANTFLAEAHSIAKQLTGSG